MLLIIPIVLVYGMCETYRIQSKIKSSDKITVYFQHINHYVVALCYQIMISFMLLNLSLKVILPSLGHSHDLSDNA